MSRTIAMLLIAVMVFVPLSEALTCAFETSPSHAALEDGSSVVDAGDASGSADGNHASCAHNHCHHSTASVPIGVVGMPVVFSGGSLLSYGDSRRFLDVSDGLIRPPRA